ncbi:hypothetical protein SERLADRAFT_414476 [Serpula lacrymans var. lacrymans S7.9]|uniref:Uncharacterized protein n=1 Tax=Serpula lacrymans var. lacrymans (strain S7.9) TaxID=578457 RepID=F8NSI0_SERL9|nr:uncharacterized protein SERLADRAFT_414476 [Serpula lacrymans var. lacrymans S7.9]EGO26435.1 hypothetical protein SERLADRAFT_414476 [Serpula lacrymans var. lacrymans S7.9]
MNIAHTRVVDRCTPRDKFARKHISLLSTARASTDDSLLTPPSSPWGNDVRPRQRSRSHAAWTTDWRYLPTPIRHAFRPADLDPPTPQESPEDDGDAQTISLEIFDRSLRDVEFDPTCLDALDNQLLLSPTDSFSDVCWAEAVRDDTVTVLQPLQPRIRKSDTVYYNRNKVASDEDPYHDWDEDFSVEAHAVRNTSPPPLSSVPRLSPSSSPPLSPRDAVLAVLESRFLYHNANDSKSIMLQSFQRSEAVAEMICEFRHYGRIRVLDVMVHGVTTHNGH